MTTCPACGADNREWASHCGECGRPLPDDVRRQSHPAAAPQTDRLPAWLRQDVERDQDRARGGSARGASQLPSIPDGGLTGSIPSWLAAPIAGKHVEPPSPEETRHAPIEPDDPSDVTAFISPEDLPTWLRRLAEAAPRRIAQPAEASPPPPTRPTRTPVIANDARRRVREVDLVPPAPAMDAPTPHRAVETPVGATPTRPRPATPKPARTQHLTALALGGLLLAVLVIAYAVYLGVAG